MLDAPLRFCALASARFPWTILLIGLLAAVASITYASRTLNLNANTDDLISPDRPFMDDYRQLLDEFGDLEYLYVVVQKPERDGLRAEECIEFIASRLARLDELPGIFHAIHIYEQLRISSRAMTDDALRELAQVSGSLGALVAASEAGTAPVIDSASARFTRLIEQGRAMTPDVQAQLAGEAVFLAESIAAALPGSLSEQQFASLIPQNLEPEFLRSESGELYFIAIMPEKDFGQLHVIQEPLRLIRDVLDEARAAFPELEMGLTGKPVLQADELTTSDRDMRRAAILAVSLIAILFMLVLGGFWHPLLAVVALSFGIAWTFGMTTIWPGQLNLLSIIFTLILVGVGIDFGVHLVTRYREERAARSIEGAIKQAMLTAGRGNLLGAVTSSIAFYMALFTHFQGLRELGFVAGSGLLLCLISMSLILPSSIVLFDRKFPPKRGVAGGEYPPLGQWEQRTWNRVLDRPGFLLTVFGVVTLLMLPGALRLGFQYNLLELQAPGLESVIWEHRILDDSAETWFGAVIVDSQEEALDVIERAESMPTVHSVRSVFDIVRPASPQRSQLRQLLHDYAIPPDFPDSWSANDLRSLAQQMSLIAMGARSDAPDEASRLDALSQNLQTLADQVSEAENENSNAVRARIDSTIRRIGQSLHIILEGDRLPLRDALPRAVRDQYVSAGGRLLVTIHPLENVWEFEPMGRFVADLRRIDPDATGVPFTQYMSLIEMRDAFVTAGLLAFGAVFLLLWIDLKSIRDAMLAIMPLLLGMLWLVCAMGLLDLKFNLANFFAVPILIGIGVDSGIHIMRRHREDPPGKPQLGTTRRAVFMTAMTSLIGFGCLATASHLGVRSLGLVMAFGAGSLLIASVAVLPALLAWLERHHWYHGRHED